MSAMTLEEALELEGRGYYLQCKDGNFIYPRPARFEEWPQSLNLGCSHMSKAETEIS